NCAGLQRRPRANPSVRQRSKGNTIMALTWTDSREIGEMLFEKYDTINPLTVRFPDLHKGVLDLEDFAGKPEESNEKRLEAIQMAWYEEWKDEYGDDK